MQKVDANLEYIVPMAAYLLAAIGIDNCTHYDKTHDFACFDVAIQGVERCYDSCVAEMLHQMRG